jgi:hypothetical protein
LFVGYKDYSEKQPKAVSFEEVYEKVKATPETEPLDLSESFWHNYSLALNKEAYVKRSAPNDIENKALNLLNDLKNREFGELKPFILSLIKDIENYGSLSEYVLRKIVELEKDLENLEEVKNKLNKIKDEIGEDFIQRLERQLEELDISNQTVIVAVENREA